MPKFKLEEGTSRRNPELDFELKEKLGEGSYGSVWEAQHLVTKEIVAMKRVPIENDYENLLKEIQHMKQCQCDNIVKCYGSYYFGSELWIAMENCSAGSAADVMKACNRPFTEAHIAQIVMSAARGLHYLHHTMHKIHRDIKAGNLLLNNQGEVKLADFGVTGQMSENTKRHTVIGTPFWMAPEVIQEVGYDYKADIWSLGITAIELADTKPPYSNIHPMRIIFMIPSKPPPTVEDPSKFSAPFNDFVAKCLVKQPKSRLDADQITRHPFVAAARGPSVLLDIITEQASIIAKIGRDAALGLEDDHHDNKDDDDDDEAFGDAAAMGTTVIRTSRVVNETENVDFSSGTLVVTDDGTGTMKVHDAYVPQWREAMAANAAAPASAKYANYTIEQLKSLIADLELKKQREIEAIRAKYRENSRAVVASIANQI